MTEYSDKMKALRQKTTQALDKPKPAYRITAALPKGGDIDEQFALIETEYAYGSPSSDPTHRKIRVGDSLPEGEVTEITPEGIKVIPDYGNEYVIPLGERPGYKPPTIKKLPTVQVKPPLESVFAAADKLGVSPREAALYLTPGSVADAIIPFHTFRDTASEQTFSREDEKPGQFEFNPDGTIDREPALWYDEETDTFEPYDQEKHGGKRAVDKNTEIYGDYIPGAEDMSADELREASFDAAAKNYGQKYEDRQPYAEEDVEIDGIPYTRETYESGEVFLVPTGEEGDIMRDYDDEEQKEKFESDVAKINAAFGG